MPNDNKFIIFIAAMIFLAVSAVAQISESGNTLTFNGKNHAFGGHYGKSTGKGLTYRYYHNRFAVQVAAWPWYESKNEFNFNQGLTFMYQLHGNHRMNLFLYQGNQFSYEKDEEYIFHVVNYGYYYELTEYKHAWYAMSAGAGVEIELFDALSLNAMYGYGFFENFSVFSTSWEIGLFYVFD